MSIKEFKQEQPIQDGWRKVVFAIQFYDSVGGAENQVIKQMPFYQRVFDVQLITQGKIVRNKVMHAILFSLYCLKVLQAAMTAHQSTVFYFIGAGFEKAVFHFINQLRINKLQYVVKFPGTCDEQYERFYLEKLKSWKWRLYHQFFDNASKIIVQDHRSSSFLKRQFKNIEERAALITNGIALPGARQIGKLNSPADVLYVGRMLQEKGIPLLIAAARILGDKVHMHFVGDGPDLEGVKVQAQDLANVSFYGFCSQERLHREFYPKADVFVFPSTFREGLPNVVLEAMSHSIPVIATDVGALPEIFENNRDILFLAKERLDQDQVVQSIERFLSDQDFREHLARNAYKKLQSSFDIQRAALENIALIEGL